MLAVSPEYITAVNKQLRDFSYQWVNIKIYNNEAANDVTATSNGQTRFSDMSIIMQEQQNYSTTYATLEPMRFLLDGTQLPIPLSDYIPFGFISEYMSDENGAWTINPLLTLTYGGAYGFSGLTFMFDPSTGDYISEMIVTWYSGGNVIDTETLFPTSSTFILDKKTQNITQITIECVRSSTPNRRARIQKVLPGLTQSFTTARIASSSRTHDVDPMARRLPTETFTVTVLDFNKEYDPDNPTGYWEYIDALTEISVVDGRELESGEVERLEPIVNLLNGKPTKDGINVTFTAQRRLNTLTETYRKGAFQGGRTLKQLAEDVLIDALGEPYAGESWWILDDILDTIVTTAPLPTKSHRECLQMIAHAGMCSLFTNAAGQIVMRSGWAGGKLVPVRFNRYTQMSDLSLSKVPPLYSVDALLYQHISETSLTEIYKSTLEIDGEAALWCDYQAATGVTITVDGATLVSKVIYAYNAYITLTGTGTATITINGYRVNANTTSSPYIDNPLISGETESSENELVVSWAHKRELEKYRASYLVLRNTYTGDYRGNPELEPTDIIPLQTKFVDGTLSLILKTTLNFNGALSGELVVKRITNWTAPIYTGTGLYTGRRIGVL